MTGHLITGHRRAVRAAHTGLVFGYWSVGREILDRRQEQGWGATVIDRRSADLRERFPDGRGDSPRNLRYMRAFADAWPRAAIVQQAVAQRQPTDGCRPQRWV